MLLLVSTTNTLPINYKELLVDIYLSSSFSKSSTVYETGEVYDLVPTGLEPYQSIK